MNISILLFLDRKSVEIAYIELVEKFNYPRNFSQQKSLNKRIDFYHEWGEP